eukprot:TRINITY_DN4115_c0_g1_i1.p1 TRINITY_DN4115_c0_g1~~TRINITY_DN4115_c0_g1_i1.p1  ORF type:complete len:241 (-),score=3.61 TRINITY_DN4115_c0_g1_i1:174-896(-)
MIRQRKSEEIKENFFDEEGIDFKKKYSITNKDSHSFLNYIFFNIIFYTVIVENKKLNLNLVNSTRRGFIFFYDVTLVAILANDVTSYSNFCDLSEYFAVINILMDLIVIIFTHMIVNYSIKKHKNDDNCVIYKYGIFRDLQVTVYGIAILFIFPAVEINCMLFWVGFALSSLHMFFLVIYFYMYRFKENFENSFTSSPFLFLIPTIIVCIFLLLIGYVLGVNSCDSNFFKYNPLRSYFSY